MNYFMDVHVFCRPWAFRGPDSSFYVQKMAPTLSRAHANATNSQNQTVHTMIVQTWSEWVPVTQPSFKNASKIN